MKMHQFVTKLIGLVLGISFSLVTTAQQQECIGPTASDSLGLETNEPQLMRATVDEIATVTGLANEDLELSLSHNPTFVVIIEDQIIPYYETGPASFLEREALSGSLIRPAADSIQILASDGSSSTIALPTWGVFEKNSPQPALTKQIGEESVNYVWLVWPALGAATCWAAAQLCTEQCMAWVSTCQCGGSCECGPCDTAPAVSCNTCPPIGTTPPPLTLGTSPSITIHHQ